MLLAIRAHGRAFDAYHAGIHGDIPDAVDKDLSHSSLVHCYV